MLRTSHTLLTATNRKHLTTIHTASEEPEERQNRSRVDLRVSYNALLHRSRSSRMKSLRTGDALKFHFIKEHTQPITIRIYHGERTYMKGLHGYLSACYRGCVELGACWPLNSIWSRSW